MVTALTSSLKGVLQLLFRAVGKDVSCTVLVRPTVRDEQRDNLAVSFG